MDCTREYQAYCAALQREKRPPGVQPDENTPIVLYALIMQCRNVQNRRLREWLVVSAPAYVYAHVFDSNPCVSGREIVALCELGHEFTIKPLVLEVPPIEWPDYVELDDGRVFEYIGPDRWDKGGAE